MRDSILETTYNTLQQCKWGNRKPKQAERKQNGNVGVLVLLHMSTYPT
jgi:hypothetical protein